MEQHSKEINIIEVDCPIESYLPNKNNDVKKIRRRNRKVVL